MTIIGIVTIGQSPRVDVVPGMAGILGLQTRILEAGAIDDLSSPRELATVAPGPRDTVLVSRLRDGRQVTLSKERLLPRVQACIDHLEKQGANPVLLLCTAPFPPFRHQALLLESERLVTSFVNGVLPSGRLGVLVPEEGQIERLASKWRAPGRQVAAASGSPYGPLERVALGARALCEARSDLIVLDCVGYRTDHKALVAGITGAPVVVANEAVAHMLAALT